MRSKRNLIVLALTALLLFSCSSLSVVHNNQRDKLVKKAKRQQFMGAIAEIGEGQSIREDVAREKARTDAYKKLAQSVQAKVEGISSAYIVETGTESESHITEVFKDLSNVITNTSIQGVKSIDETILKHKDGYFIVYSLYVITPRSLNKKVMKILSERQPELYSEFIQSATFQDLLKEVEAAE